MEFRELLDDLCTRMTFDDILYTAKINDITIDSSIEDKVKTLKDGETIYLRIGFINIKK